MSTKGRASSEGAALNGLRATRSGLGLSRNGLGLERVVEIQRARIVAAMTEVSVERGVGSVTVAHVVERAGVSRRTFYEIFVDREDCFLAACDEGIARACRYVIAAYDPNAGWAGRIRMALTAVLEFLDVERGVGRLLIVGSLGAGTVALERRQRVLAQMITVVDEGRREAKAASGLPPLTAEGVVGGVLSVLHARLLEKSPERLVELTGQLMGMIVLPYLGASAARRQMERPISGASARGHAARSSPNPLMQLEMRLTYRTVRVLMAIAAHPGSSNRVIADASGVMDQGQMSKLLARLAQLSLIANTGAGPARGEPNAWTLTDKGWHVQNAIAQQTMHS
jgi:AcrR family transcriptional regulator